MLFSKYGGILSHHIKGRIMKRHLLTTCFLLVAISGCAGGSWGTGVKPKTFRPGEDESIGKLPLNILPKHQSSDCSAEDQAENKSGCNKL
jgi:hypothetical protein